MLKPITSGFGLSALSLMALVAPGPDRADTGGPIQRQGETYGNLFGTLRRSPAIAGRGRDKPQPIIGSAGNHPRSEA